MRKKYVLLLPLVCFVAYISLTSSSGGVAGGSTSGCSCHGAVNASTLVSISGLPSGGYTNGAIYSVTVSVTNATIVPSPTQKGGFSLSSSSGTFAATAGTSTNVAATEINHSSAKTAIAGTASWTFNWTAPSTGNSNVTFNLAGNAVNGNGNTSGDFYNQTSVTIIKSGQALAVTAGLNPIACNGGVATIASNAIGGVPPYTYQKNTLGYQASNMFASNLAGTYTITVKDAVNTTASTVATLNQPTAIVPTATASTINCFGTTSTITASGTGGTGAYNYRINVGTYQPATTFTGNLAATYTVTVRDANLCTKTTTLIITQPNQLSFTVPAITPPVCNGLTGSFSVSGMNGTGTKTLTIAPLGPQSAVTTANFTGLTAQAYTVTVTDANLCTRTTLVTMTQPTAITFNTPAINNPTCASTTSGSLTSTAIGGTGALSYSISPLGPQTNATGSFTNLTAQSYTITAKDANNCTKTSVINLTAPACNSVLNLKLYLEGFYLAPGSLTPAMFNSSVAGTTNLDVDDITVHILNAVNPAGSLPIASATARLKTNGTAICTLSPLNGMYYISIEHRNSVRTCSANPIFIGSTPVNYDFTTAATQAFGGNQVEMQPGKWAFYSGDIDQNGTLDNSDFSEWETDANNFAIGYLPSDLDGDGAATNSDFSIWETNANNFVSGGCP
jgi:hypothetical protein